ncbi:histidine kinase [Ideonella sp. 4Y16]|uniref:sensor histidine kinase n=1 Tax=Ideonella alba TaxID=2824118 RepID=UPI001B37F0E9|nr:ATP-binding protein [Ideonella alba]MBQ0944669.1 histidine kinase [Ideonella alba]
MSRSRSAPVNRDDSRLGALGLGPDLAEDGLTGFGPGFGDSSQLSGLAQAGDPGAGADLQQAGTRLRVLRSYTAARVVIGVALLLTQIAVIDNGSLRYLPLVLVLANLLEAALCWQWLRSRVRSLTHVVNNRWLWWATVAWDLAAFGAMHWLAPVGSLSHAALLVLPALMSGILSSRTTALATAALAALGLLAATALKAPVGELPGLLSQAGLVGIGLFMIVILAGELATRLARQERSARHNLSLALQQAELNRLVIDEMADGVLVVDGRGGVRAANPAARALLAEGDRCPRAPFSLHGQRGWLPLLGAIESAYENGQWPAGGMDLTLAFDRESPRSVRVRARFTRRAGDGHGGSEEVLAVLFVEELKNVLARQRQERLVAMGRISAGIAHEIRNPLAAISQANALLQEDNLPPDQQRLARIVSDNVERLKRIVDDVMEVAPSAPVPSRVIDLCAEVAAICGEWARTAGVVLGSDSRLQVRLPGEPMGGMFDSDHLRRVLINLLENALRHASREPGAVRLSLEPLGDALVRISVASDGEPIAPEVEAHLFEPFHSTRSRGTGLGLYICRELCERHGASIDYLRRAGDRHANVFQVVMRSAPIDAGGRLYL